MADLFKVIVSGVAVRDDHADAAKKRAADVDPKTVIRSGDVLREVVRQGLLASMVDFKSQVASSVTQVKEEGIAIRNADPRSLKPVTDVDIAAHRAAQIMKTEQ